MMCPNCKAEVEDSPCINCGEEILSDPADTMEEDFDRMVQRASLPNLSTLFKDAQDRGRIKPQVDGSGQPS